MHTVSRRAPRGSLRGRTAPRRVRRVRRKFLGNVLGEKVFTEKSWRRSTTSHRLVSRVEEKAGPSSYETLRTITSLFLTAAFNKRERRRGLSARRFATPRGENTWSILVGEGTGRRGGLTMAGQG